MIVKILRSAEHDDITADRSGLGCFYLTLRCCFRANLDRIGSSKGLFLRLAVLVLNLKKEKC